MKNKKKSRNLITIILLAALLVGTFLLAYPTVSNWWNTRIQSRAVDDYNDAVTGLSTADYDDIFAAADDYNERLREAGISAFYTPELVEGYYETLDITGTGIMGYVTIEKIQVQLPIYHGTSADVLQVAAGHLQGTTLPVGGESTHAVIMAHRGLPSAKLFTDLSEIVEGDTFTITVLDRVLTYEVDQILIVLPEEVEDIQILEGEDYVTLMTCTPYGINTHRLLVRGHRVDTPDGTTPILLTGEANVIQGVLVAPFIAVIILIPIVLWVLLSPGKRKKKKHKENDRDIETDSGEKSSRE